MKKRLIPILLGLALPLSAQADTILGVYAGAGNQNFTFSGDFESSDSSDSLGNIDLDDDLGLGSEADTYFYIALEHPVPFLPNLMLASTTIEQSATSTLTRNIEFNGETFTGSSPVNSTIDLSHTDATLYYEILDNWVSLDLGLTIRKFDGEFKIESAGTTALEDVDFVVPLLYGKAQVDLPFTGLYVAASGNWIGAAGNTFVDATAKIGYESVFRVGIEAGYRTINMVIDADDVEADLTFAGAYIAATVHF